MKQQKKFAELTQRSLIADAEAAGRRAVRFGDQHSDTIRHVNLEDFGPSGYAVTSFPEGIVHWLHEGGPVTLWKDESGNITSSPCGNLQPVAVEYFDG